MSKRKEMGLTSSKSQIEIVAFQREALHSEADAILGHGVLIHEVCSVLGVPIEKISIPPSGFSRFEWYSHLFELEKIHYQRLKFNKEIAEFHEEVLR
nr:hypothetical protein pmam_264 [Pithovirus mammoth]